MPGPGRGARPDGVHTQLLAEFGRCREVDVGGWRGHGHLLKVRRGTRVCGTTVPTRASPLHTVIRPHSGRDRGYFGKGPPPVGGLPGAGPLACRWELSPRAEVKEYDLVGAGTGTVVGSGGLTGLVGVVRRGPADVVLRIVLEPLRSGRGRDDRQVGRDVLRDRLERRGLLGGGLGPGQLGQHLVDGGVLQPLVVAGRGLAAGQRAVQPAVVHVVRVMPPLDQCEVSWKLPEATSAFHASTDWPWKVASIPAAFNC